MRLALALLLAGAIAAPADARMHAPYRGHRIVPANAGALDGFTAPQAAYSFRRLRTAYAGSAVKLQRVDTTTQDIGFTASGDFDTAAATAFCTTACTVTTWYDQSGNARHVLQASVPDQPLFVFNCNGALPCMRTPTAATTRVLSAGNITPATGVGTFSAVANRSVGTGLCFMISENGATPNYFIMRTATTWSVGPNASNISATVTNGAWHAGVGVLNGASSVINMDGVETTGTAIGNVNAGQIAIGGGSASTTCDQTEAVIWDNYALTPAERSNLIANQRNYWMPAPLDSFTQPSGAYSFRKLKSTYAGPALRIRRASDNAETDIGFLGFVPGLGAPLDVAAANAHCAATSCFVKTLYDQSGNASDMTQATVGNQPPLVFNCLAGLPCLSVTTTQRLATASQTPGATLSLNAVAKLSAYPGGGTVACQYIALGAVNWIYQHDNFDITQLQNGSGSVNGTATRLVWHSHTGVMNGASTVNSVDGVVTTGSMSPSVTAGGIFLQGGEAGNTCQITEAVAWNGYPLAPGEVVALRANQKSFWGTP